MTRKGFVLNLILVIIDCIISLIFGLAFSSLNEMFIAFILIIQIPIQIIAIVLYNKSKNLIYTFIVLAIVDIIIALYVWYLWGVIIPLAMIIGATIGLNDRDYAAVNDYSNEATPTFIE